MNPDAEKIETLTIMAERLTAAIEADIAALTAGRPQEMRSIDPQILQLSQAYGREAAALDPARTKLAPAELRNRFIAATAKFRDTLKQQNRLIYRMRNASEGLIKAIADEVERKRAVKATYSPPANNARPKSVAMVFNGVV